MGTRDTRSTSATADTAAVGNTVDGGPALFRLVRFWSRRWSNQALTRVTREPDGELRRVQHIQVVEAVAAVLRTGEEAAVTDVAEQLGLDHSGASRMVRDAVAAGYLARGDSTHDRRRVVVQLTDSGHELLTASHDWQRRCFDQLTAAWNEHDRSQFASYLQRLADEAIQ
ncbi:MarR family winged helix-turn-helix transcriptional regulator [Nocardia sp. NBC_00508]|uniref:MarR family winged helix-turn-helix transcriptional regulator n=1 Tax=Nocardia sp. NBC_00508 TaxID=2975992 RepID=UPI002E815118|nr:MarR family winged helix-turn-helix transcriptional regulator [Nocardia sp. NBC_00508]WUD65996.1 MarR family winged helix-turn-helix transcriptional regulator [Nocardia sp. NBC_00508]